MNSMNYPNSFSFVVRSQRGIYLYLLDYRELSSAGLCGTKSFSYSYSYPFFLSLFLYLSGSALDFMYRHRTSVYGCQ